METMESKAKVVHFSDSVLDGDGRLTSQDMDGNVTVSRSLETAGWAAYLRGLNAGDSRN